MHYLKEMPINIKRKVPDEDSPPKRSSKKTKQRYVTCHQDAGDVAILCQWCSMWEHRICAGVSVNEYDVLSNSCNKIMFFCSVCCPKVSLALKLEDKNSFLTLECENIHKAISDLSAKIENLCSSEKELEKNIKETTTTLSTIQPYNVVSDSSCSMAVDIVKELEDKERGIMFLNVPVGSVLNVPNVPECSCS